MSAQPGQSVAPTGTTCSCAHSCQAGATSTAQSVRIVTAQCSRQTVRGAFNIKPMHLFGKHFLGGGVVAGGVPYT